MPVLLPTIRPPKTANMRPLDFGAWQTPTGPGAAQRLERLGSRFALDIVTGQLRWVVDRRPWISALLRGVSDTVVYPIPQPGLIIGLPGDVRVNGAGQAGQTIVLDGFTPGYIAQEGQFFSILSGGQRFVYAVTIPVMADGAGNAAVEIWPPLRRSPLNDAPCEFAIPMIEGALSGNEKGWTDERAHTVGLALTITEVE